MARTLPILIGCLLLLAAVNPAVAAWSTDPAVNNPIADRISEQVVPKVAVAPNGDTYVSWFDLAFGGYQVWLQRLDGAGRELWPHNGILVSDHVQPSSLVDWDLLADSGGGAVVAFTDSRAGEDLDVYAYRIAPDGTFLWGPDGLTLSANLDYEVNPSIAELSDGNFAVIWPRIPDAGSGSIMIQKISPDGQFLYDPPVEIVGGTNEMPAFATVVAADAGGFIVGYVRDIRTFQSPRHVRAQKFSAAGVPLWGAYVNVYDAMSVPIAHLPSVLPDGAGGAVFGWHRSDGSLYNCFVQHLLASGVEKFAHNGVAVSTMGNTHHIDPAVSYRPASDEIFVFWNARNSNQNQWGIFAQKISPLGARAWTDAGRVLQPIDAIYEGQPRTAPLGAGAVVLFFREPTGSTVLDEIVAMRLDADGASLWGPAPVAVSSLLSDKARLPIAMRSDGVTVAIWEDDRAGTIDVYGQSLNPDGTLGIPSAGVDEALIPERRNAARPNPFARFTRLEVPEGAGGTIAIYDGEGRVVRTLQAADGSAIWDGRDDRGRRLPGGTYFYRSTGASGESGKAILLK
jgi:hypothetical protein